MAARTSPEVDQLWDQFHRVVNMTSRELLDWLGTEPDLRPKPGPPGRAPLGLAVVDVLGKRRADLTVEDIAVMQKVIDVVDEETSGIPAGRLAQDERRRNRLKNIGHDLMRAEVEEQ